MLTALAMAAVLTIHHSIGSAFSDVGRASSRGIEKFPKGLGFRSGRALDGGRPRLSTELDIDNLKR